ncbi:MAG TPA: hypothetical protein DCQ31_01885 [Bacteroidales bacterium]|nr:hypothetical protein [Bacteroidales bacterium]
MKKRKEKQLDPNRLIGSGIEFMWLLLCIISMITAFYDLFFRNNQSSLMFAAFSAISLGMYFWRRRERIKREMEMLND